MTRHNSQSATERPDVSDNTPSSPSLSRRSTGPDPEPHRERRDSKLAHIVDSVRRVISQEEAKLFGDTKTAAHHRKYESTVAERLEKLREQDQMQRERVEEEILTDPEVNESVSPAVEARKRSDLNENNMGLNSHEEARRDSWGWPGLGTYPATSENPSTPKRRTSLKITKEELSRMEPRMEAATYEAIDNSAELESYGWPGLGSLPGPKK